MDWIKIKRNLVPVMILRYVLQVKMAAMACVPITRTRRMETEILPHPSTVLVLLRRPTRAHLHSACPERNLHHLVAAATTTDTVPIINHTIAASPLLQRRRKRSMKVCLHCLCIRNSLGWVSESGYRGMYVKLISLHRILNWKPEAKGPLDTCRSDSNFFTVFAWESTHFSLKARKSDYTTSGDQLGNFW
jgi:hypothetical protein